MSRQIKEYTPPSSKNHEFAIFSDQLSQMYAAIYSGLLATIINACILTTVLWPVIEHDLLITWLSFAVLISSFRLLVARKYKSASVDNISIISWYRIYLVGSIFAALLWTTASIWLFPAAIEYQVFLAFVAGGMVAGAVTSLSYIKTVIYTYIALVLIPLLFRFFISDSELGIAMGSMLSLFLLIMLMTANRTYNNIKQNIVLHLQSIERERSLIQSENRYKILLETATDAFFLHDMAGNIIDVNQEACNSLNYSHDELLKLSVSDIVVGVKDHLFLKELQSTLMEKGNIRVNAEHQRKDGSTFPVESSVGLIEIEDKVYFSVLARDVTERERIDKMKNEFISTVSHELRTPLTSIRGSLGLINGGVFGTFSKEMTEVLKVAGNNTERLLLLINDILDIQKIESGEMTFDFTYFEVVPFLQQSLKDNEAYANQYNVKFVITDTIDGVKMYADKARMMQVMANLLSNAVKFSAEGSEVEVGLTRQDKHLRISVTDHGVGIAEAFQNKIFEKFTQYDSSDTRQKGGTGLGLSITKLIIESHNGKIGFISQEGQGTTFYVDMPTPSKSMV